MVCTISIKLMSCTSTYPLGIADQTSEFIVHIENQEHVQING